MKQPAATWDVLVQATQMREGRRSAIAIDDTKRQTCRGESVAHAAIVVVHTRIKPVLHELRNLRDDLRETTGCDYFHFRALFHGKKPYEALATDQARRLSIVGAFVQLIVDHNLPIAIAEFGPDVLLDLTAAQREASSHRSSKTLKGGLSYIQGDDPVVNSRLGALFLALAWMGVNGVQPPVSAFMDRSREKPPLRSLGFPRQDALGRWGVLDFGLLDPPGVQECMKGNPMGWLADFAAWSWTRLQGYEERTDPLSSWDHEVRKVLKPVTRQYVHFDFDFAIRHINFDSVQLVDTAADE